MIIGDILFWLIILLAVYHTGVFSLLRRIDEPVEREEPKYQYGIRGAEIRVVNNHEVEMFVKGRVFRIRKTEDGTASIREKRRGHYVGRWLTGAPNAWKYGQTQNQTITNYLANIVNNNKPIWGDDGK